MSRFYLVEFRYRDGKRWRPWKRTASRVDAVAVAREMHDERYGTRSRAVLINTDVKTFMLVWESP